MATKTEIATAHHEAGHAVAAWHLGIAVRMVMVTGDRSLGYLGRMVHAPISTQLAEALEAGAVSPAQRQRVEGLVMMMLAGELAERRHRGRANHLGASEDRAHARSLLTLITADPDEESAYLSWLFIRARNLVEAHWPQITAVAAALLEQGTLTGRELRALLEQ